MHRPGMLSIWFFIGVLLLAYGILILGAGIYGIYYPPDVVDAGFHVAIWWGILLILMGGFYTIRFSPKKGK